MWIETSNGNRISRRANINNPSNISISENCTICEHVTLHGDVVTASGPAIRIGKFTHLAQSSCVHPPPSTLRLKERKVKSRHKAGYSEQNHDSEQGEAEESQAGSQCLETVIGNYTFIGEESVIRSIQVGNRVQVGARCILGEQSVINDCCVIEDDTTIPPKAVIPPYSRVSGKPGASWVVHEISPSYRKLLETNARIRQSLT